MYFPYIVGKYDKCKIECCLFTDSTSDVFSTMEFPIRCFSCGKPINQYYDRYCYKVQVKHKHEQDVLDKLKIKKECCRRMFLSHVEMDNLLLYPNPSNNNTPNLGWKARKDGGTWLTARIIEPVHTNLQ